MVERLGQLRRIGRSKCTVVFDSEAPAADGGGPASRGPGPDPGRAGRGDDHRTALDRAEEKLRRQLDKAATRPAAADPGLDLRVTLRLRDLLARRGDPLQLEALTGELGLDRFVPDSEVASPGLALAGLHRALRARPAPRAGRDRDHLSRLARRPTRGRPRLEALLRLRSSLRLRHQGAGGAARAAGAGPRRAACPSSGPGSRRRSSTAGSSRSWRRRSPPAPRSTARWPTSTASACSSSGAPASARASACWTWSSGGTAWWPTTSCR